MARSRKKRIQQADVVQHFAARLKELRRNRGYSQATLAQAASVSTSYVTRLENGLVAPGIDLVARLSEAIRSGRRGLSYSPERVCQSI